MKERRKLRYIYPAITALTSTAANTVASTAEIKVKTVAPIYQQKILSINAVAVSKATWRELIACRKKDDSMSGDKK